MMKTVKSKINQELKRVCYQLWPQLKEEGVEAEIEYPREDKYGDYSTNLAFKISAKLQINPMAIGNEIITGGLKIPGISRAEVVPPGFINFHLDSSWLAKQIGLVLREGDKFGRSSLGKNKKVNIEFISANPTGPLHIGNGRGAFLGDTLASILDKVGYRVMREYYVNDIGKQADRLAESVTRRYLQQQGIDVGYPEECYQGKYIDHLAKKLNLHKYKLTNINLLKSRLKYRALQVMLQDIKRTVKDKLKVEINNWFSEKSLYKEGTVDRVLDILKEKELLYQKDGAIWLKTSQFGDDKDRVVVKKGGEQTYFLSDIAYLWNKLKVRKFDLAIDLWGADHHGYVKRMKAAEKALGFSDQFAIIIFQLVKLLEGGVEIRMSKRSGTYVTLEELVDEVGLDAARFFFLLYAADTHMDFDLTLAKKRSEQNPVYYVQYAHARICSIIKKVSSQEKKNKGQKKDKNSKVYLRELPETNLARTLIRFPEILEEIAGNYQINKLPNYARELATAFHDFYTQCRVIEAEGINHSRLQLAQASQQVLAQTLSVMGIKAPTKM